MKGRESKTGSIAFFLSFSIVFAESVLSSFRVQTRKVLLRLKVSWFFSTSPSQSQLTGQYWESEMTVSRVYMHIQKGIYHFKKAVNDETQLHNAMPPMPQPVPSKSFFYLENSNTYIRTQPSKSYRASFVAHAGFVLCICICLLFIPPSLLHLSVQNLNPRPIFNNVQHVPIKKIADRIS